MESKHILNLKISDLVNSPYQGRLYEIDSILPTEDEAQIQSLMQSIEANGLMQPIIVRPLSDNKYELVDGHRRVIAYSRLGRENIRAIVKNYDDQQAQVFSIIGNLQRKNLSLIENAIAFQKIMKSKFFTTNKDLAKAIGKDETYVGDVLNILKMDQRLIDDLIKTNCITF